RNGSSKGATDWSAQVSATTANAAGPQAMSIGSVTSGAASARRAAQKWNGIAPNPIATAAAKPRYAKPKTSGTTVRPPSGRPIQAVARIARTPATAGARSSRLATTTLRGVAGEAIVTRTPNRPPAVAARTPIRASVRASARTALPMPASSTPGALRWLTDANPSTVRASATRLPMRANSRRYSDPASSLPPMASVSSGRIRAAAALAAGTAEVERARGRDRGAGARRGEQAGDADPGRRPCVRAEQQRGGGGPECDRE